MDTSSAPPPPPPPPFRPPPPLPPEKGNGRIWIWVAVGVVAVFVFIGVLAAIAIPAFYRAREKAQASRAAFKEMDKTIAEESDKMAKSIRDGNAVDRNAAADRMKQQLEKSATQFGTPDEAAAARAMAGFISRMQQESALYETAQKKFIAAQTLKFNFPDRDSIEEHRKITREFLAANAKLTDVLQHSEDLVAAQLDAAHISATTRNATLDGFKKSHGELGPLMMKVRGEDDDLGKTVLTMLDLLDHEWGNWRIDPANGKLVVPDATTRETVNQLLAKVQTIASAQAKDQVALAEKMRNSHQR